MTMMRTYPSNDPCVAVYGPTKEFIPTLAVVHSAYRDPATIVNYVWGSKLQIGDVVTITDEVCKILLKNFHPVSYTGTVTAIVEQNTKGDYLYTITMIGKFVDVVTCDCFLDDLDFLTK